MSNRELVQQLNGALMNSMGQDFEIRADFVREIIAALSARSETPPIPEYDNSVPPIYETLAAIAATVPDMPEPQSETPVDVLCERLAEITTSGSNSSHRMTAYDAIKAIRVLESENAAHGRIEDQLESGAEALKADIAELRDKLAKRDRLIDAQHTTQGVLHAENVKQRERAEAAERQLAAIPTFHVDAKDFVRQVGDANRRAEAAGKDAERYRWLRFHYDTSEYYELSWDGTDEGYAACLDTAIDAALAAGRKG